MLAVVGFLVFLVFFFWSVCNLLAVSLIPHLAVGRYPLTAFAVSTTTHRSRVWVAGNNLPHRNKRIADPDFLRPVIFPEAARR